MRSEAAGLCAGLALAGASYLLSTGEGPGAAGGPRGGPGPAPAGTLSLCAGTPVLWEGPLVWICVGHRALEVSEAFSQGRDGKKKQNSCSGSPASARDMKGAGEGGRAPAPAPAAAGLCGPGRGPSGPRWRGASSHLVASCDSVLAGSRSGMQNSVHHRAVLSRAAAAGSGFGETGTHPTWFPPAVAHGCICPRTHCRTATSRALSSPQVPRLRGWRDRPAAGYQPEPQPHSPGIWGTPHPAVLTSFLPGRLPASAHWALTVCRPCWARVSTARPVFLRALWSEYTVSPACSGQGGPASCPRRHGPVQFGLQWGSQS